ETNTLHFYEHDMRKILTANSYDYVFSFFTSMGYFDKPSDDTKQFKAMSSALKQGGSLIIDFLNTEKSKLNIVRHRMIQKEHITFNIESYFENGFFNKITSIIDGNQSFKSHEKVKGFLLTDFEVLLHQQGLKIINVFGNYNLDKFDIHSSDRLIIHAKK
ncbi:MAG: hypothetical protein RI955_34, partial [Bacteroidota bacterium]